MKFTDEAQTLDAAIRLLTFPKPKYGEQIVAIKGKANSLNTHLFDACDIFMEVDTYSERLRVKDVAREFAERFVAQMNRE
jgi:hypothetical protein